MEWFLLIFLIVIAVGGVWGSRQRIKILEKDMNLADDFDQVGFQQAQRDRWVRRFSGATQCMKHRVFFNAFDGVEYCSACYKEFDRALPKEIDNP